MTKFQLLRLSGIAVLLILTSQSFAQTTLGGYRHDGPGRVVASSSTFSMGVSNDNGATFVSSAAVAETVLIRGEIRPEAAHIGLPADIFVVDRVLDGNLNHIGFLMRTSSGAWVSWNGSVSLLQPFREDEVLAAVETLDLFTGTLATAGEHRFFLGYMPADGILRYHVNGLPITITEPLKAVGIPDTSFNTTGQTLTTFGTNDDVANAIAIQTDGKIVVAGTSYNGPSADFAVARYNTNGSLDTTFDTDGKLTTFLVGAGSRDTANAAVIQPDGKIVVAGSADNDFALVRYNTNGSLDTSFGSGGKVTTSVVNQVMSGEALALQTDGKIVLAGTADGQGFAVARYNSNGSLDTSFDSDGMLINSYIGTGATGAAGAIAIQADGKIVVQSGGGTSINLARFNTDGSVDAAFAVLGRATVSVPFTTTSGSDLYIQPDGRIVTAGTVDSAFALFRFDTAGNLETIFERSTGPNVGLRGIVLQADGKFVAAGYSKKYLDINGDFVLRRYNADGSIDGTFGTNGTVVRVMGGGSYGGGYFEGGRAVAIQTDGKIVVAGTVLNGTNTDFVIIRYE